MSSSLLPFVLALASAVPAAAGADCDVVSTDVAVDRSGDEDVPYDARVLLTDEATGARVALRLQLTPGVPARTDITASGARPGLPATRVAVTLAEDLSDVRYIIEVLRRDAVCQTHRGRVPLETGGVKTRKGPRFVPLAR